MSDRKLSRDEMDAMLDPYRARLRTVDKTDYSALRRAIEAEDQERIRRIVHQTLYSSTTCVQPTSGCRERKQH